MSQRILLPTAVSLFLVLALVLPAVRLRLRSNTWGVTLHRNPSQRLVGAAMALAMLALVGFLIAYAWLGPEALGVIAAPRWLQATGWLVLATGLAITMAARGASASTTSRPSWSRPASSAWCAIPSSPRCCCRSGARR
jgi:hypothetical protein